MTCPRRVLLLLGLALAGIPCLEIGCAGPSARPIVAAGTYAGPPVGLDASGESYVVVIHPGTPGWIPTLDRITDEYRHSAVFITLRRPNPAYLYSQMQVEQRVGTSVVTTGPVKTYVRVFPFDAIPGEEPYYKAAESAGNKRP